LEHVQVGILVGINFGGHGGFGIYDLRFTNDE